MAPIDTGVERMPGRGLDDLAAREERALAVDIFTQPGEQRGEIAFGDTGQDRRIGTLRRVEELRRTHPRAYEPWTDDEDARLRDLVTAGAHLNDIAATLERQRTAIRSRMDKLGLEDRVQAALLAVREGLAPLSDGE